MTPLAPLFGARSFWAAMLAVLVGVSLGAGSYTYHYGEGLSYLSSDPKMCVNCHIMRDHYDGWQKASHHAVANCNDCHTPHDFVGKWYTKGENGFWHSYAFTLQNYHDPLMIRPKNGRVLQGNCIECHHELVNDMLSDEPTADGGAGACVRCHASVGHGPAK